MQRPIRLAPLLLATIATASCGWYDSGSAIISAPDADDRGSTPGENASPTSSADEAAGAHGAAASATVVVPPSRSRLEAIEVFERPDARLGNFVDGDVVAYFEVDSLDELESIVKRVAESGLPRAPGVGAPIPLQGDRRHLDATRPIGVALTLAWDSTRPTVTTILPVQNRAAFLASVEPASGLHAVAAGDYVALTTDPVVSFREEAHPITADMPAGTVRGRADLVPLLERFGPAAEQALGQLVSAAEQTAEAQDEPRRLELVQEQVEVARAFLRSAERLDVAFTLDGAEVLLDAAVDMRGESELADLGGPSAESLRELALCVDPSDAVVVLGVMDAPGMRERVARWVERLGETVPSPLGLDSLVELAEGGLAPAFAASGEVGLGATRFTSYYHPEHPDAFVELVRGRLGEVDVDALGIQRIGPRQRKIGQIPVTEYLFARRLGDGSLFSRSLLGFFEDGLRMRIAHHGDVVALVTGGDDGYLMHSVVRLGKERSRLAHGLDTALERVGEANPCFVLRLDMARIAAMAVEMASARGDEPGVVLPRRDPVLMTVYGGIEGRVWRFGLAFDYVGYASLLRSSQGVAKAGF